MSSVCETLEIGHVHYRLLRASPGAGNPKAPHSNPKAPHSNLKAPHSNPKAATKHPRKALQSTNRDATFPPHNDILVSDCLVMIST